MWFWFALAAAVLSSIAYVFSKHLVDKISVLVVTWSLYAFSLPFLIYANYCKGIPEVNRLFFISVLVAGSGFAFLKVATLFAFKKSTISKIMPLNSSSLVAVYFVSLLLFGESLNAIKLIGLFLIILGLYWLNISKVKESWWQPFKTLLNDKASLLYLASISSLGILTPLDKLSFMNTRPVSPLFALLGENLIAATIITLILFYRQQFRWLKTVKVNFVKLIAISLVYILVLSTVFYGFANGPVALVIGIKKLQVLFALLWAWWFLGDKPKPEQVIGATVMISGAVLVKW